MENTIPSVSDVATTVANSAGGQMLDAATTVIPLIIPVLAAFWAIRFVLRKVGLGS